MSATRSICQIEANPEGLSELRTNSSADGTKFDLVAVHGLTGDAASTWRHENGSLWFDWLTSSEPTIRVLLFGYPAAATYLGGVSSTISTQRLFTLAEQFCVALLNARLEKSNPITFLGHGVGGIIIKAALNHCHRCPTQFADILKSTHHVVFLDTPHLGFEADRFGAIFGEYPTAEAARQFRLWSTALDELSTTFGNISSNPKIHFTTSQSTEPFQTPEGAIVPALPAGSTQLYVTSHETVLHPFEASHFSMCNFAAEEDYNYTLLRDGIIARNKVYGIAETTGSAVQLVPSAETKLFGLVARTASDLKRHIRKVDEIIQDRKIQSSHDEIDRQRDQKKAKRVALLDWLWPIPTRDENNQVVWEKALGKHTAAIDDTCEWLLHHLSFTAWKESGLSQMAFLHGIPGSGKSTLLAHLIARMHQADAGPLGYWFCDSQSHSTVMALKAISYQLLWKADDDTVIRVLSPWREQVVRGVELEPIAAEILKQALLSRPSSTLIIDALDEAAAADAPQTELFLSILQDLVREIPLGVKVFCSSRNLPKILKAMASMGTATVDIDLAPGLIQDDLDKVITHHVAQSGLGERLKTDTVRDFVMNRLRQASHGMFLLPIIMIKDLCTKVLTQDIYDFFDKFPKRSEIDDYYLSLVMNIDDNRLGLGEGGQGLCAAQKLLTWLLWSKSALTFGQLHEVMSYDGTEFVDLEGDIKLTFGCLVEFKNEIVQISHPSIRRFLLESNIFRESNWYERLILPDPHHYLAAISLDYMLRCQINIAQHGPYLTFRSSTSLQARHLFLDYACVNWLYHWQEAESASGFADVIWILVCGDNSKNFLRWHVATAHFLCGESFISLVCLLESLILERTAIDMEMTGWSHFTEIQDALRRLKRFVVIWGSAIDYYPMDVLSVLDLVESPHRSTKRNAVQRTLLLSETGSSAGLSRSLLDRQRVDAFYDRFILSQTDVFLWRSLMPCFSHYCRTGAPLDTELPQVIELTVKNMFHYFSQPEFRRGIEEASAGTMMASCVLSRDWKYIAIAWPRYNGDKTLPLHIKTYVFYLSPAAEDDRAIQFAHVPWTESATGDDPCLVDITYSNAFRGSRGVVAFTMDNEKLWTTGGLYDLNSGHHTSPPSLLRDSSMSRLTISSSGTRVAGIRGADKLELYELAAERCQFLASTTGATDILSVPPLGHVVLFLAQTLADGACSDKTKTLLSKFPQLNAEICLLDQYGQRTTLWQYLSIAAPDPNADELRTAPSLDFFYNNGGLQAFSDDGKTLVLYIPTFPERQLVAFDLQAVDVAQSATQLQFQHLFDGADLVSFTFTPMAERQLCLLDCVGSMRTLDISTKITVGEAASKVVTGKKPIPMSVVLGCRGGADTSILCHGSAMVTEMDWEGVPLAKIKSSQAADMFPDLTYETSTWNLESLQEIPRPGVDLSFIRYLLRIPSRNLLISDPAPVIRNHQLQKRGRYAEVRNWADIAQAAQRAIQDTIDGNEEYYQALGIAGPKEPNDGDLTRVSTMVTFDEAATMGFFQSVIYNPVLPERGQPTWQVSMIVNIQSLDTPRARKTGTWSVSSVGTVYSESLACTYHQGSKMLAYSVSLLWDNRARPDHRFWAMTRLCLCALSEQGHERRFEQIDDRGTFLNSEVYAIEVIDEQCITSLTFSACGRYVYGLGENPSNKVAFMFDVMRGYVVRRIPLIGLNSDCMTFAMPDCRNQQKGVVQIVGIVGVVPVQMTLSFESTEPLAYRELALGPRSLDKYERATLLSHPDGDGIRYTFVASGQNFLRRNGVVGGGADLGAVVLSRREECLAKWEELEQFTAEDVEEPDEEERPSLKTELRQGHKELCEAWEKWMARQASRYPAVDREKDADDYHGEAWEADDSLYLRIPGAWPLG